MARGTFVAKEVCRNIGYYILVTRPELPDVPLPLAKSNGKMPIKSGYYRRDIR